MNELHKAYAVLGLEPGSSLESILRRYKRLIMVWHPDRAPSLEHKEFAEEELKKINNAKDLLNKHFGAGGGHKSAGCACQPEPDKPTGSSTRSSAGSGPGPNYQRNKSTDEKYREDQAARKRDAERKAREEQEANAKRAQEQQQKASQQNMESAMQQQKALSDEKLRWQISIGIILAFIGLEVFGSMAMGVKHWWHDFSWKWQNEHSTSITPNTSSSTNTSTDTNTGSTAYIPPYYQTPGGNPTTWQQEQQQRDKEQKERDQKQHDQDVYFTRLDLDKYQKAIEHCNSELANLEIKIADPAVSDYEKRKLMDMRDFRQKNLAEAEAGLKAAQDKYTNLTGEAPPQTAPSLLSPLPGSNSGVALTPLPNITPSPFASPADPNIVQSWPSNSTSTLPSLRSRFGMDSLSSPSSTSTSFSELVKKFSTDSTTSAPTQVNPFFGKKDPLSTPPSSSRFSELLKKLETKPMSPTDTNIPSN
jgi:curved DNA-binding protein CbpA